jgi:predicted transposase/invertase (TIGR01784 family)
MSREEIEAMFGLSELKQTRVYQEGKQEGKKEGKKEGEQKGRVEAKLEAIPRLLVLGLTVEQIAQALDLELAQVQQAAEQTPPNQ